jgi:hypothetical protein
MPEHANLDCQAVERGAHIIREGNITSKSDLGPTVFAFLLEDSGLFCWHQAPVSRESGQVGY